jgi:D-glycero-D-manno-heptose 1,7-bisphosphate phosphatase
MSARAVFLDRDGVIAELVWDAADERYEGPHAAADVTLLPGAADAIRRIRSLDYRTVVVSNQPAAAKGKVSRAALVETHERVVELLAAAGAAIDDYRYCFHHPDAVDPGLAGDCDCRKPRPGMLLEAAAALDVDLARSWMIGDADSDAEAGRLAGCRTVLVENPRSAHRRTGDDGAELRAADLARAVDAVAAAS